MTSRTWKSRSPPSYVATLFVLAALGCPGARTTGTGASPQPDYFNREGNFFHDQLDGEAKKSTPISPDTIVIGLLKNTHGGKNLTYIPSELRVVYKETTPVTWLAWDGPFTLTFTPRENRPGHLQDWPFQERKEPIRSTTAGAIQSATMTVLPSAEPGAYHFTVLLTPPIGPPYEDKDCPPIIIQVPVPSP